MTLPERILWEELRRNRFGHRFRRQSPCGPYILDFVCLKRRLVIEVDGSQHGGSQKDEARDRWLGAQGFRVLRFWNDDVRWNLDGVMRRIEEALAEG
jgi:BirA family biotin operon repressor/biotin-[acetyl-CoA-carboxylase] ligase